MQGTVSKASNIITFGGCTGEEVQPFAGCSTAVSPEADVIREAGSNLVKNTEASHLLFGEKAAMISEILALADECEDDNWDGNGAKAITDRAAGRAVSLIRSLPSGIPLPEIAPEPGGRISFDWIVTRHTLFSLSVGLSRRLPFAWIDGGESGHGVALFDGSRMPPKVLLGIHSIINRANSTLWAA